MYRFAAGLLFILLFLAACDTEGIPRVTPTVAPTNTPTSTIVGTEIVQLPSRTPIVTLTNTDAPTSTATLTPSNTPTETELPSETPTFTPTFTPNPSETTTPSQTATQTSTATRTPSSTSTQTPTSTTTQQPTSTDTNTPQPTATFTATITPTFTSIPTETATLTQTPSLTPLPLILPSATATNTPIPTPTFTATIAILPTETATNTVTPLPATADLTQIAEQVYATRTAFALTQTAVVGSLTPPPPPTIDVTPTFITAAPDDPTPAEDLGIITPVVGEATQQEFVLTTTPTAAPTVAISVPIPATVTRPDFTFPEGPITNTGPLSFAITGGGGTFTTGGFNLGNNFGVDLFARNPVDPSRYALTNAAGSLYSVNGGGPVRVASSPFSQFDPQSRAENNTIVTDLAWSPDGQYLAFITDPMGEIWYFRPGGSEPVSVYIDCKFEGHPGCQLGGNRQFFQTSYDVTWSPQSDAMLVQGMVNNPEWDGHGVLYVLGLGQNPREQPPALLYDFGSWSNDGSRIVVSGRNSGSSAVVIATVNRDGGGEQVILDASALGLWVQNAVQRPNGSFIALGRQGDRNGAMRLIDQNGNFITGDIGAGRPERVEWSPDRSAVLVRSGGRQYIASVNGSVSDITDSVGGGSVNWVSGGLPAGSAPSTGGTAPLPDDFVPSGVVEGSRYTPGQQLQVIVESLNIREQPSLEGAQVGGVFLGEWVAVLAGPVNFDNIEWWRIQAANGVVGWLAGQINGFDTLGG